MNLVVESGKNRLDGWKTYNFNHVIPEFISTKSVGELPAQGLSVSIDSCFARKTPNILQYAMTTPSEGEQPSSEGAGNQEYGFVHDLQDIKPTRFRFKSKRPREDTPDSDQNTRRKRHEDGSPSSRRHRHRHHHRRKKREESKVTDDPEDPVMDLDPEAAFRESLFDAMADDEGAMYWEGVYGQPIHHYPRSKPTDPDNPRGELEEMSDDEYAAYVRTRMWEKSHQHILEERRLREEAARKKKESRKQTEQLERERELFDQKMEESLRRGSRRRTEKAIRDAWAHYARSWEELAARNKVSSDGEDLAGGKTILPWPVLSGDRKDVDKENVEDFFKAVASRDGTESNLRAMLKLERVRWHPDRMSHLLRGKIDDGTLKTVTAVFQIVDTLWAKANEAR